MVHDDLSPYAKFEEKLLKEELPEQLIMDSDFPQDLSSETWSKLIEHRDRKIQSEKDVRNALRRYNRHQQLATSILSHNDELRSHVEQIQKELDELLEFKFQNLYNVETLLSLKQGQVNSLLRII